jgi:hypothetical protein
MKKGIIGILFLSIFFVGCNNVGRVNNKEKENTKIIKESDLTESENYNGIKTCEEGQELVKKEINEGKENTKIIKESDLTESEIYNGIKTCEEGQELAKKEINEGKIKYIFSGFGSKQEFPNNLEKLYGIEIIKVEGVLGIPNKCYNDLMYKAIQEKFGKDAFNKAME